MTTMKQYQRGDERAEGLSAVCVWPSAAKVVSPQSRRPFPRLLRVHLVYPETSAVSGDSVAGRFKQHQR